ncbi:MAG: preprotein translocase subunit SecG [Candidatus Spechtbacteria bacterium]|nr:preprotein translocase subunit SecG [Candidatus Spechtbacteria bacterium]
MTLPNIPVPSFTHLPSLLPSSAGWISIAQIAIAILLVIAILLQQRGSGLSSAFGGQGGVYYQKRGFEKVLYWSTIVLGALFAGAAFLMLLV